MSVFSKNAFDILGNDADEEGRPTVPVQTVDKTQPRKGKRDAPADAPVKDTSTSAPRGGGRGGRGGRGRGGSEGAFQDRSAGRAANRDKPMDDGLRRDRHANRTEGGRIQNARIDGRGGRGGAGGRGGRGGKDDRHSRTGIVESAKQSASGWGEDTGNGEWNDEKAGEQIAAQESKEEGGFVPDTEFVPDTTGPAADGAAPVADGAAAAPEPEDKSMSLQDYYASLAAKREAAGIGSGFEARKANEGAGKKQPEGKEIAREEDDYFIGGGGKNKREREKKEKNQLILDHDFAARERDSGRGGRGGRGRGRGDGAFRGEGRGRGGRGGRGDAGRGDARGARGGRSPNIGDMSAFPSLGGS